MDFRLSEEMVALQRLARQVVQENCIPLEPKALRAMAEWVPTSTKPRYQHWYGILDKEEEDRLTKISRQTGLYDAHIPKEFDGGGLGTLANVLVQEETSKSIVYLPRAVDPCLTYIYDFTQEQRKRFLWPVLRGEKRSCFAQTEPNAGSDPGGMMETSAVRNGDDWIINGVKTFVSGADIADFAVVLAVTDKQKRQHGGITIFLVDKDRPGFEVTQRLPTWLGIACFELILNNCVVPSANVLGEVGLGFQLGQKFLTIFDRLLRGAAALGMMQRSLEMSISWAKQRVTFGQPIANRQAIQWMLVEMWIDIEALRALTYQVAWKADQGEDVRIDASMIKLVSAQWACRTIDKAIQIHGGLGETLDLPLTAFYHIQRHARIGGGTDEIQRYALARHLLRTFG